MSIRCANALVRPFFRNITTTPSELNKVAFKILPYQFSLQSKVSSQKKIQSAKIERSNLTSAAYQRLCSEFYEIDKPRPPLAALNFYSQWAAKSNGLILEPMCGSGRFLIPLLQKGFSIHGFDSSKDMLNLCRTKCKEYNLPNHVEAATFQNFKAMHKYSLVMIPSGSFCLLADKGLSENALIKIHKWLDSNGLFIFEVDTPQSATESMGVWKGNWVTRCQGSKIVQSYLKNFDPKTSIQTSLHRYELWESNRIVETQVEEFYLRLYSMEKIELLLSTHGFKVMQKLVPYTNKKANDKAETLLYVCGKQK